MTRGAGGDHDGGDHGGMVTKAAVTKPVTTERRVSAAEFFPAALPEKNPVPLVDHEGRPLKSGRSPKRSGRCCNVAFNYEATP